MLGEFEMLGELRYAGRIEMLAELKCCRSEMLARIRNAGRIEMLAEMKCWAN